MCHSWATRNEALSADDYWISSLLINDGWCAAVEQLQTQLCRPATVAYGDWVQVPGELGWGINPGALKNSFTYSYVYSTFFNVRFKTFPGFSLQLILALLWRKIWRIFQRDALPSYSLHFYFHFDYHDTVIFIDLELSKTFIYRKPHNTDNILVYAAGHLGCTWHSWCPVLPAATWLVWCAGSWADLPGLHCAKPADCCGPQGEFNFIVSIWLIH